MMFYMFILIRFTSQVFLRLQFEEAAKEVADEVTRPRPEGDEEIQDIQVMLTSRANPASLRALKARR